MKNLFRKAVFVSFLLKTFNLHQSVIFLPKDLILDSSSKCLLLAPHPDDESIGCGGLLLKYPDNFEIVCLTDGRHSDKNRPVNDIILERKREFESAMASLNINNYSFLEIEDRKLIDNSRIFETIDIQKYDYIFLPNYLEQHPDHKAVTTLVKRLIKTKKYKNNLKLAYYEVWSPLPTINFYLNISDIVEKKMDLINIYKSQTKFIDYADKITALNKYRGLVRNVNYAEAFSIISVEDFKSIC